MGAAVGKAIRAITVMMMTAGLITGCSTGGDSSNPYAAEIAAAQEQVTTPVGEAILADGVITDAEYAELKQSQAACMTDAGYPTEVHEKGLTVSSGIQLTDSAEERARGEAAMDEAMDRCSAALDVGVIVPLYGAITGNPLNEAPGQMGADCMIRHDARDGGYSAQDFLEETADIDDLSPDNDDHQILVGCLFDPAA